MTKKIKVVQVLTSLNRGGIETWLKDVVKFYDKERFQIDFILTGTEGGAYAPIVEKEESIINIVPLSKGILRFGIDFYKTLKREKYDVIHAHPHFFCGYLCFIAFLAGVPLRISHSHNDTSVVDSQGGFFRKLYLYVQSSLLSLFSNKRLACSNVAGKALFGNKPFELIYCGIDFSRFNKEDANKQIRRELRQQLNIPPDGICVGHVGRFNEQKNHEFLIDIFKEINIEKPNTYLLLVGIGPLTEKIKHKISSDNINNVLFLGGRDDVNILMKNLFDVFLFPSLYEGLPLTILEAQASGLKCLISDTISAETIIVKKNVATLPLSKGAYEWAKILCDMIDDDFLLDNAYIKKQMEQSPFSIQKSVFCLEKIYRSMKK